MINSQKLASSWGEKVHHGVNGANGALRLGKVQLAKVYELGPKLIKK